MDEQPILQPTQAIIAPTFFSKNKRIFIIISILIVLAILILISMIIYKKYTNTTKTPVKISQTSLTPTPTIDKRFISIPSKNDTILDSLPKIIKPGIIYFYKNTEDGGKGEIASYLKSKIVNIDKKQKSLSLEATNSATLILIKAQDSTLLKSIRWNRTFKSKPNVKDISFNDLEVSNIIAVSMLKYDGQGYIVGTIIQEEGVH